MDDFKAVQILNPGFGNLVALQNTAGGDLSGTFPNPTVATVGGQSAANVASGAVLANAAVSANTASAIVKRDGAGKVFLGEIDLSQGALGNFKANTTTVSATTYTLLAADMGRIIWFTSASAVTLTIPSGLPTGFNCLLMQTGAGQVTWSASGTTIIMRAGFTKTAGIGSIITVAPHPTANTYVLNGDGA